MIKNKKVLAGLVIILPIAIAAAVSWSYLKPILAQDQVILEILAAERKYSAFPDSGNAAFAQTFILPNGGSLEKIQLAIRAEGPYGILNIYQVSSTTTPPNYPTETPLASFIINSPEAGLNSYTTVVDITNSPLELQANTPYAILLAQGGPHSVVDFMAADRHPDNDDAYVNGELFLLKSPSNQWGVVGGGDMALRLLGGPLVKAITIDIKPGSYPNSINTQSNGKIPVAILSSPTFNAFNSINKQSLTFGKTGSEPSLAMCNNSPEDANGDGILDLVCHFLTQAAGFTASSTMGTLKGSTVDNLQIAGQDSVSIVH